MKMLLLILSAIMSWFVTSKNTISGEGEFPSGIEVHYACTYQKGDVRANDTASISFANMGAISIERIEVYVKSNKTAGAGNFTVVANSETVATKTGTFKDWTGAYDNSEYHAISLLSSPLANVRNLSIELVGTTNSLHIEKYVIQYTQAPPRTVTLMAGGTEFAVMKETAGGKGIELPILPDVENWHFMAWTANPFNQISTMPTSWINAGWYMPQEDCTLWAVYEYKKVEEQLIVTNLQNGIYVYTNLAENGRTMSGSVIDGMADSEELDLQDMNQWYEVNFEADGTATIQTLNNDYIGFSGTKLSPVKSYWQVFHEGNKTAFYTIVDEKTYILWPNVMLYDNETDTYYSATQMASTTNLDQTSTVLLSTESILEVPMFTCYPEYGLGIENTSVVMNELVLMRFGNYELIIRNGQKELRVW